MDFLEYKNYLSSNNIKLFDHDCRISYSNMFKLNDMIYSDNQTGGSSDDIYYISPFIIIKKYNKNINKKLINNLVDNNLIGAKYLCQNNLVLKYI